MANGPLRLPAIDTAANQLALSGEKQAAVSGSIPGFEELEPEPIPPVLDTSAERRELRNKRLTKTQQARSILLRQPPTTLPGVGEDITAPTVLSNGAFFAPLTRNIRDDQQLVDDIEEQGLAAVDSGNFHKLLQYTPEEVNELNILREAIENWEKKKPGVDLTALGALIDDFTGSRLAATYEKPMGAPERDAVVFKLKNELAQRARTIADNKVDLYNELVQGDHNRKKDQLDQKLRIAQNERINMTTANTFDKDRKNQEIEAIKLEIDELDKETASLAADEDESVELAEKAKERNLKRELKDKTVLGQLTKAQAKAEEKKEKDNRERSVPELGLATTRREANKARDFVRNNKPMMDDFGKLMSLMADADRIEPDIDKINEAVSISASLIAKLKQEQGLGVLSKQDFQFLFKQVPENPVGFDPFRSKLKRIRTIFRTARRNMNTKLKTFGFDQDNIDQFIFGDKEGIMKQIKDPRTPRKTRMQLRKVLIEHLRRKGDS